MYKWLKGDVSSCVHAVYEGGVLQRGAGAVFAALRRFWVPVYTLDAEGVALDVRTRNGILRPRSGGPLFRRGMDPEDILAFCKQLKTQTAGGPDGWGTEEWKRMDLRTAGYLAMLMEECTRRRKWPDIFALVHTVFIPKGGKTGIQEVSKLRPISIANLAYRTWAWVTLRKAASHAEQMVHECQFGGIRNRGCPEMYLAMQLEMERVLLAGQDDAGDEQLWEYEERLRPFGYTEDSWKFFDTLQPPRLAQLLVDEGFQVEDVELWLAFYKQHRRKFRLGRALDDAYVQPTRGVLQGCSLSLLASNLLIKQWCLRVERTGARPMAFVDDREVEAETPHVLQRAIGESRNFNDEEQIVTVLEADKTYGWQIGVPKSEQVSVKWGEQALSMQDAWVLLGSDVAATKSGANTKSESRRNSCRRVIARVQALPLGGTERQLVLVSAALSKLLYAQEAQTFSDLEIRSLRTQILGRVWWGCKRRCPEAMMALCLKGHLLDPEMALTYRALTTIKRCMGNERFRIQWRQTWAMMLRVGSGRAYGPAKVTKIRVERMGWTWTDWRTLTLSSDSGESVHIDIVESRREEFEHLVRTGLRKMLVARAAKRRKDFEGADQMDIDTTRQLLVKASDARGLGCGCMARPLRYLLSGAVMTQRVRFLAGLTGSEVCPFCQCGTENMEHILWHCPQWGLQRQPITDMSLQVDRWPPCMRLCGHYVHGPDAPDKGMWPEVQATLAAIIQARFEHMKSHGMLDTPDKWNDSDGEDNGTSDEENDDFDDESGGLCVDHCISVHFPLFRRFAREAQGRKLDIQVIEPRFKCGDTRGFDWSRDTWKAITWYWHAVHIAETSGDFEGTPWIAAMLDAAIACGIMPFARADGDLTIGSMVKVFTNATKRMATLCKCTLLLEDGKDSKRLKPLWLPAVSAMACRIILLRPEEVNDTLEQWGKLCLQLEVEAPEEAVPWSKKLAFVPKLSSQQACKRIRLGTKTTPNLPMDWLCNPAREAQENKLKNEEGIRWNDKLSARQCERRFAKAIDCNVQAISNGNHIVRAAAIDERPTCAICGKSRRQGHWLRLAQEECKRSNPTSAKRAAKEQNDALCVRINQQEEVVGTGTTGRDLSHIKNRNAQKAAAQPLMPIAEAKELTCTKQRLKELGRHGLSNAQKREVMGAGQSIAKAREEAFKQHLSKLKARGGKYHQFELLPDGEHVRCTRCGKQRVRLVTSKWQDEQCAGEYNQDVGGSKAKLAQAQEKLDKWNQRRGKFHVFGFSDDGKRAGCTRCGKFRGRDVISRWKDEVCPEA